MRKKLRVGEILLKSEGDKGACSRDEEKESRRKVLF